MHPTLKELAEHGMQVMVQFVRDNPGASPPPCFYVVDGTYETLRLAILEDVEEAPKAMKLARKEVEFLVGAMILMYDGYVTEFDERTPCPFCLGDGCAECKHTGHAMSAEGRVDCLRCLVLQKGQPDNILVTKYKVINGRTLLQASVWQEAKHVVYSRYHGVWE